MAQKPRGASQVVLVIKNHLSLQDTKETWVQSLRWEDPLEEGMATRPSYSSWRTAWTVEPGRLQSIGQQGVGHD